MALKRTKVKLKQPSQQGGTKNIKSPQFKHVKSDDWAGSRKSSLAPFRLIREFTGICGSVSKYKSDSDSRFFIGIGDINARVGDAVGACHSRYDPNLKTDNPDY